MRIWLNSSLALTSSDGGAYLEGHEVDANNVDYGRARLGPGAYTARNGR